MYLCKSQELEKGNFLGHIMYPIANAALFIALYI